MILAKLPKYQAIPWKKKTVKETFHSFHLVYPGVFLLAIKLGLRQPLRLLLQHLQSVQQLLQGGLILPPTGHGSVPWLLWTHCPLQDLLGTKAAVEPLWALKVLRVPLVVEAFFRSTSPMSLRVHVHKTLTSKRVSGMPSEF